MPSSRILVVTGLLREARMLAGPGLLILAGGGDRARLEREIGPAASAASGLISIGLGGALADGLGPGDWVVADAVLQAGPAPIRTDAEWSARLLGRLPGAVRGPVVGSDAMVATVQDKQRLRKQTGALAVDMESHVAGLAAERHGLAFAVARVISDGADRALPKAAQAGMKPDGGMDAPGVIAALARRPWELPALIRTGLEAGTAFQALFRGRQLLGPALMGPGADLG